ncbi:MAG: hypothetical protein AAFS11_08365, partial [Planctomycetota bacterium]
PIAIRGAINRRRDGDGFTEPVEAVRAYRPSYDLEQLGELRVSVVPRSVTTANLARQQSQVDCTVDVGLQQRVDAGDDARLDALLDLAEQIGDHLRHKRLPGYPQAAWLSIEHEPVVAAEHLDERSSLTTVLSVTYRVRR